MFMPAPGRRELRRTGVISLTGRLGLLAALGLSLLSTRAIAEVGGSVSVSSDDRFRGQSLSDGHPVVSLDLSYDDVSGFYLAGKATADIDQSAPRIVNVQENLGYAWKTASGPVIDVGIVRSDYTEYDRGSEAAHYTEFYAGIVTERWSSRLHYSPDYFRSGVASLYADVDANLRPASDWRLTGHAGLLVQLAGPRPLDSDSVYYDWRVSISRRLGPLDFQLAWSGGGPSSDYYGRRHSRTAITTGASYVF
jgi:uncharacterized protein (TIGR02001 family)